MVEICLSPYISAVKGTTLKKKESWLLSIFKNPSGGLGKWLPKDLGIGEIVA